MKHEHITEVVAGILMQPNGQLLFSSRPQGKAYAGYWEFPGGKVEAGESLAQALARELHEELGIRIQTALPWRTTEHVYEHAHVRLHWFKVLAWLGELQMREGQQVQWQTLPPQMEPILPGAWPVLDWLQIEAEAGQLWPQEEAAP